MDMRGEIRSIERAYRIPEGRPFEALLAELAVRLAEASAWSVAAEIRRSLGSVAHFFDFERGSCSQFGPNGAVRVLASTASGATEPWPAGGISIPLRAGGRVVGALSFGWSQVANWWNPDAVTRLTIVGGIFAGAIARTRGLPASEDACLARLSARERQVMDEIVRGRLNKQIAADLGISMQTVKVHRAHVMKKAGVASFAELVRLWVLADLQQLQEDQQQADHRD